MAIAVQQTDLAALLAATHWGTANARRKETLADRVEISAVLLVPAALVIVAASATGEELAIAVASAVETAPAVAGAWVIAATLEIAAAPESVIDPELEEVEVWGAPIAAE
jgi:hypothetical protein